MLALYKNVSLLWKFWRFTKMFVHTIEMLASYEKVGALWKCRRTIEMSAFYEKVNTI